METLSNQTVLELITNEFGDAVVNHEDNMGMLCIEVTPSKTHDVISWLKNHPQLQFNFLTDLCGVHYPDNQGKELGMVYHLHSFSNNYRLRIKCFFSAENPVVATLTDLWSGANWQERETFDFYGIEFTGHPNLKRIMNMDSMDYFPLRKEYALEDETREDKSDKFFGR